MADLATEETIENFLLAGDLEAASNAIDAVLAATPNDPSGLVFRGRLLGATGDLVAAEAAFHQALEVDPRHARAKAFQGILAYERGDADGAEAALNEALAAGVDLPGIHFTLARCAARRAEHSASLEHLERALAGEPENGMYLYAKAHALTELGRIEDSVAVLGQSIQANPMFPDAWLVLAQIQMNMGQPADAVTNLKEALRVNPGHPALLDCMSRAAFAAGDASIAIDSLTQITEADPGNVVAAANLALAHASSGRMMVAEQMLRRLVHKAPDDAHVHFSFASVLESKGDPGSVREAVSHLEKALRHDPNMWEAACDLGRLLVTQAGIQNVPRGISLLEQVRGQAGDRPEVLLNLAIAYAHAGRSAEAKAACSQVLADPSRPDLHEQAGKLAAQI
jgi:tetratricopeptide (TPR) repeat protein